MRDYSNIDKYLDRLNRDIYPQPPDSGHSALAEEAINYFLKLTSGVDSVLDLGCGEGFCQPMFEKRNLEYTGVCLQRDFFQAREAGRNVFNIDYSFLPFDDKSYDFLFSRHSLEHSPMPLLTLMEWERVCKKYLAVVLPSPDYWGQVGRNHYFVLSKAQWTALLELSGFRVVHQKDKLQLMTPEHGEEVTEFWFLLEKK